MALLHTFTKPADDDTAMISPPMAATGDIRNAALPDQRWDDIDIHPERDPLPLLPEGTTVDVRVAGSRVRRSFDGSWRVELVCEVIEDGRVKFERTVEGDLVPVRLPLYLKLPPRRSNGRGHQPAPLGSKFYRMWVFANRGRKPGRRDRMSLTIFKDRMFMARTRVVKKDHQGNELAPALRYSVVGEFLR